MPDAADQADGGLDADDAVVGRRADDRAVGLGADGQGAEAGGDGHARARARAAGVAVQHVGVARLAADAAPAARGIAGAEVGPLAQVGLGQDNRARPSRSLPATQLSLARIGIAQRRGAGRGRHRIDGVDIVLEDDRDAVQRAAHLAGLELGVQLGGDLQSVGVDAQDGVELGATAVEGLDPIQVALHDVDDGEAALLVALAQLPDGRSPAGQATGRGSR